MALFSTKPRPERPSTDYQPVVKALGQAIVSDLAPRELPLFEPISQTWFNDKGRAEDGARAHGSLPFNHAEMSELMTPVVLTVATRVIEVLAKDLAQALMKEAADEIADRIKRLLKQIMRLLQHKVPADALTSAQVELGYDATVSVLTKSGRSIAEAEKFADSVAARLSNETYRKRTP